MKYQHFSKTEPYDKVISDQKDTVDNLLAATNANILNRNNN